MAVGEIGPPRSFPIKSLEQLRNRSYFDSVYFSFNKSSVPLRKGASSREKRPRLLGCHDMKGGYLDDQWIQGSENADAYTLTHWRLLDIFVYFSHNLVTIPPPSWTNAAHLHGVQVLGTFITEWSEGQRLCMEFLASKESARMYADRLAELAQVLGFDGWLINIENPVAYQQVANLQEFVRHLSNLMHLRVPESIVIWYDSVTTRGWLAWQNCLNENNRPFFDICDGIFTNYAWKAGYPKQSATEAGDRAYDVYMGVDVFGRNTFGGGGYQCDVALKVARDAGVSAALFAPGWSYETNQDQKRWWDTIENCWPAARQDPVELSFFTNFDIGHGAAKYIDGKQISDRPWSNLSCQNLQPLLHVAQSTQHQLLVYASQESTAYSGGSSIKMTGDVDHDDVCLVHLYHTDTIIEESSLNVSYSVLAESNSNFCLALSVQDPDGAKVIHFILDSRDEYGESVSESHQFTHVSAVFEYAKRENLPTTGVGSGRDHEIESLKLESVVSCGALWSVRDFILKWGQYRLVDVFGICSAAKDLQTILIKLLHDNETLFDRETYVKQDGSRKKSYYQTGDIAESNKPQIVETSFDKDTGVGYSMQLGHISIVSTKHEHSFTNVDREFMGQHPIWLVGLGDEKFLSIHLSWNIPTDNSNSETSTLEQYHLFVRTGLSDKDMLYLGMAMVGAFIVYMLPVPKLIPTLTFYLHCQCACGKVQSVPGGGTSYTIEVIRKLSEGTESPR